MRKKLPDLEFEYVFTIGAFKLSEAYEYLDRIKAGLIIGITVVKSECSFDC